MRIGIPAQEHDEIFGVHRDYLNLIEEFGTPVVISPIDGKDFWETYGIDGLVLPGGSDVNPRRYGALTSFMSYRPNQFLEYFDIEILPQIIQAGLPVFGICRGLQTLNVVFGGTLWQHLWKHPTSSHKTHLVHKVSGKSGTFSVNSFHHQCIWKLAGELNSLLVSEDNVVEAISHQYHPISAVQWHPERIRDDFSLNLMQELFG